MGSGPGPASFALFLLVATSSLFAAEAAHRQILISPSSSSNLDSSSSSSDVSTHAPVVSSFSDESSSSSSSSSAETTVEYSVLSFTATLTPSTTRRRLLDRPDSTCGSGARPKDKELGEIVEWMKEVAVLLGVRRVDITAQGLAVGYIPTRISFTVYVMHVEGDFSVFPPQTLAGASVSAGVVLPLAKLDGVNFHRGNRVVLEANLQETPPSVAPNAIDDCHPW